MIPSIYEAARQLNISFNKIVKDGRVYEPERGDKGFLPFVKYLRKKIVFTQIDDVFMENPLERDEAYLAILPIKEAMTKELSGFRDGEKYRRAAEYAKPIADYEVTVNEKNMAAKKGDTFFIVLGEKEIGFYKSYLAHVNGFLKTYFVDTVEVKEKFSFGQLFRNLLQRF